MAEIRRRRIDVLQRQLNQYKGMLELMSKMPAKTEQAKEIRDKISGVKADLLKVFAEQRDFLAASKRAGPATPPTPASSSVVLAKTVPASAQKRPSLKAELGDRDGKKRKGGARNDIGPVHGGQQGAKKQRQKASLAKTAPSSQPQSKKAAKKAATQQKRKQKQKQKQKQRGKKAKARTGVGCRIVGIDGGKVWAVATTDEGNVWRMAGGRMAKKITEGVKWLWEGHGTRQPDPSVRPGYTCHTCGKGGHFRQHCPLTASSPESLVNSRGGGSGGGGGGHGTNPHFSDSDYFSDDDDDSYLDSDSSTYGCGRYGAFSSSDVFELACQGVKPWDSDAEDVMAALSADY